MKRSIKNLALWFVLIALLPLVLGEWSYATSTIAPPSSSCGSAIPGLPSGTCVWKMYVYGNGEAISKIFDGMKMIIDPAAGGVGYKSLLYLISLVGFISLAIAAGYDPGKNFIKMFTYIIMAWMVSYFTYDLKANVMVIDKVDLQGTTSSASPVITGAPAIAVLPAALISTLGEVLTVQLETAYTIPNEFKISNSGKFHLFGRMIEDAGKYKFTDSNLKNTIASYTADCVVPALARGRLSGKVITNNNPSLVKLMTPPTSTTTTTVIGQEALLKSSNYLETLASAKHPSIFTKYYGYGSNPITSASSRGLPTTSSINPGAGWVAPCDMVYDWMKDDINQHAAALAQSSEDAWTATGVQSTFGNAFNAAMVGASTSPTSPADYIKQQAFINSSHENFRNAALQTGNNEIMQALAITQADVQQKSAWVAGFQTFNNMMGYVYSVLQALLFALTPLIIAMLLLPGTGKSILANYLQILIWLALWQPMLSIVNFIITLFSMQSIAAGLNEMGGNRTMSNDGLVTEKINNLTIAAQFLGTMTPMITWGIIKGAMAFTEFIQHGIGNSFAQSAGAQAATGNYSLNNASMDNLSMEKISTQRSVAIGNGALDVGNSAGSANMKNDWGGSQLAAAGQAINYQEAASTKTSASLADNKSAQKTTESAISNSNSWSEAVKWAKNNSSGQQLQYVLQNLAAIARNNNETEETAHNIQNGNTDKLESSDSQQKGSQKSAGLKANLGWGTGGSDGPDKDKLKGATSKLLKAAKGGIPGAALAAAEAMGFDFKVAAELAAQVNSIATESGSAGHGKDTSEADSNRVAAAISAGANKQMSGGRTNSDVFAHGNSKDVSSGHAYDQSKVRRDVASSIEQVTNTRAAAIEKTASLVRGRSMDQRQYEVYSAQLNEAATVARVPTMAELEKRQAALSGGVAGTIQSVEAQTGKPGSKPAEARKLEAESHGGGVALAPGSEGFRSAQAGVDDVNQQADAKLKDSKGNDKQPGAVPTTGAGVRAEHKAREREVRDVRKTIGEEGATVGGPTAVGNHLNRTASGTVAKPPLTPTQKLHRATKFE